MKLNPLSASRSVDEGGVPKSEQGDTDEAGETEQAGKSRRIMFLQGAIAFLVMVVVLRWALSRNRD